jgi:hypothetical protein
MKYRLTAMSLLMGVVCMSAFAQGNTPEMDLLETLMIQDGKNFRKILKNKDLYEVQIIYTQIDRDENNIPSFTSHFYNVDEDRYFYPASTVKMPVAFLALERMNELKLSPDLYMATDSTYDGQTSVSEDTTSNTGMPSVSHYIKKIFIVSDNDAFNRLYEFLGQEYILEKLNEKGYDATRIIHRLSIPLSEDQNRHTNPVNFISDKGDTVYQQPMRFHQGDLNVKGPVLRGKGYIQGDDLVNDPMDFTHKNFFPLEEMQLMLRAVIFPEEVSSSHRFKLNEDQQIFLLRYMSQLPKETTFPQYSAPEYYDAYSKFLLFGNDKTASIPENIRIFNKIGLAYGFAIDNAYIVDLEKNIEFLLSAVIHTNKNEIYNDGKYEYEKIAFPFLKNLGRLIYDYELNRSRAHQPDLSRFKVQYDKN